MERQRELGMAESETKGRNEQETEKACVSVERIGSTLLSSLVKKGKETSKKYNKRKTEEGICSKSGNKKCSRRWIRCEEEEKGKKTRKRQQKGSKVEIDEALRLQRRTRYLHIKMKMQQSLIDAYSTVGWKAQRAFFLLLLVLHLLLTLGASVPAPALTIQSPDGDIIDCVDRTTQPAFSHPLLKYHKFQETPTEIPNMAKNEDEVNWQIWHRNGTECPKGTVPIRKVSHINGTTNSEAANRVTRGHEYAIGSMKRPTPKIYGTKATMSVWHPKIEQDYGEFSLAQIWLVSGSYDVGDLNTIEAGWQVYPHKYLDNQPRLFIFWTRDAYKMAKCYNLECAGFVQTSHRVVIGGAISPTSTFRGAQTDLTIQIWKDIKLGLWWLGVGFNNGTVFEAVGYWPTEIFTRLIEYAEMVQWGGEITNRNISGQHTTTQMGSGYFPGSGFGTAAYMRDLEIAANKSHFQPLYDLEVLATNPSYYNIKKSSNTSFLFGGPERARAVRLRLDPALVYFTFVLFFIFYFFASI